MGRLLHSAAIAAVALAVILGVCLGAAAWRLGQGPWQSAWLAHRLERAASSPGATVRIGEAALAWEGFSRGADRPLDVRLASVTATNPAGAVLLRVPQAEVSLSVGQLLLGRLRPRVVILDHARIDLVREPDGSLGMGNAQTPPEPMTGLASEMGRPVRSDWSRAGTRISQLRRIRVIAARVSLSDRQLGATLVADPADIDLKRRPKGGMDGTADVRFALGRQVMQASATATLAAGGTATDLHVHTTPVSPAALAAVVPALRSLAALDAPVGLDLLVALGPKLDLRTAHMQATAGAGRIALADPPILLDRARIVADATPTRFALLQASATIRARADGPDTTLTVAGHANRGPGPITADLAIGFDHAEFADLPVLWPKLTDGGARPWLTENMTAGTAHDAHVTVTLTATDLAHLGDAKVTKAGGTIDADALVVHWLRPVPPVDQGRARVTIVDPDTLEIAMQAAHQQGVSGPNIAPGGLRLVRGTMQITGIMHHDQFGAIDLDIAGPVADAVALLRHPRLKLLSKHPIDLGVPAGQASLSLAITLPLKNKVEMAQVGLHARAHLTSLHLGGVAAGRDLDQGTIDMDANQDGLTATGDATLGGIPAGLGVAMDFRAGPPSQVLQTVTAAGTVDAKQLKASGLDTGGLVDGAGLIHVKLTERRDGTGDVGLDADLRDATLNAAPLQWTKPAGQPATADLRLRLDHDRLVGVDRLSVEGAGISVQGSADYVAGQPSVLHLDRLVLGKTQAHGTIRLPPAKSAAPIRIAVAGQMIDLSGRFSHHDAAPRQAIKKQPQPAKRGTPWVVDANFDRAIMGEGQVIGGLGLHADNDGLLYRSLTLAGKTGPAAFRLAIEPEPGGHARSLTGNAADAGALLKALDIGDKLVGGTLTATGRFDDTRADHPLNGTATIGDFRVRGAPVLAKLLQAITLYGLVDAVSGPGLGFTKMIAPFSLTGDTLDLFDARAYDASLGLTAKGRIDIAAGTADLAGTIVPAYFFNSILGKIPLVGGVFSSERGGGLFAAAYTVRGPLASPTVAVNPLSALTPGFLRGLFGF